MGPEVAFWYGRFPPGAEGSKVHIIQVLASSNKRSSGWVRSKCRLSKPPFSGRLAQTSTLLGAPSTYYMHPPNAFQQNKMDFFTTAVGVGPFLALLCQRREQKKETFKRPTSRAVFNGRPEGVIRQPKGKAKVVGPKRNATFLPGDTVSTNTYLLVNSPKWDE